MLWFWAAAAVSLMTAVVHIIVGGGEVMAPLMAADMPSAARETLALAWHLVSATLLAITALYVVAALRPTLQRLGLAAGLVSLALAAAALATALRSQVAFWMLPQWTLLVAMAVPGLIAGVRR